MAHVLIVYGTTEGQTAKIAQHVADVGRRLGHEIAVRHAPDLPDDVDLGSFQGVIVGASVHEGNYQRSVTRFVERHKDFLASHPNAFFSVSLSAASGDLEGQATVMQMIKKWSERTGWTPGMIESVAGALKYTQYNWLKRALMKQIAKHEGGDTDTSQDHEYTDFDQVTRFAERFFASVPPA